MSAPANVVRRRQRGRLWEAAGFRCHYCDRFTAEEGRTTDHIVPKAFGGPDAVWNSVPACEPCNGERADRIHKCPCPKCRHALDRFHKSQRRKGGPQVVWRRKHISDDALAAELLKRWQRARDTLMLLPDPDTLDAAALRGKAAGLREALSLLAFNSVDKPELLDDEMANGGSDE